MLCIKVFSASLVNPDLFCSQHRKKEPIFCLDFKVDERLKALWLPRLFGGLYKDGIM